MAVEPIPTHHPQVVPYLIVPGVAGLLDFLWHVFDAREEQRTTLPDGRIMHAQTRIGDSVVMMGEPTAEWTPMPASIHVYVRDVDAAYRRALDAGAESVMEPADQFYGDRMSGVKDPSGNLWWIATHVEDVSPEEIARRQAAMQG